MRFYFICLALLFCLTNALYPIVTHSSDENTVEEEAIDEGAPTPIVIWHGMGDSCCNPLSMGSVKKLLKKHIPGVYVLSLMLGSNVVEDTEHGFFANMNDLVQKACDQIGKDENLRNGYHGIGFSQGGLFVRALAQRCPQPQMKTLVSVGGPQQGIYGLPYCLGTAGLCNAVRHLLNYGAYERFVQKLVVQAQYWHDPYVQEGYANKSIFLADLNCASTGNCPPSYKQNLSKLKNMLLVKFLRDEMIVPKESEWFGYYPDDSISSVVTMENTPLFKEDWIGLKTLNDTNRLHFLAIDGQHLQIPGEVFVHEIIEKFLKDSPIAKKNEVD